MDVSDCIRVDRATRDFADREVTEELLKTLVDSARRAGSGHNRQPWTFIALRDRERITSLAEFGEYTTPLRRAPAAIVIAIERSENEMHRRHDIFDCGRAAQNLMLTATANGLGTVPQAFHDRNGAGEFLELPEGKAVLIGIAVGYPTDEPDEKIEGVEKEEELDSMGRKPITDALDWETYG